MKKAIIITLVIVLVVFIAWLSYYLYKKSLVNKLMYNCKTDCDKRRDYLMTKSIKELKQLITDAFLITNDIFDSIPVFKTAGSETSRTRSLCPIGYHWVGSLATGGCKGRLVNV